MKHVSFSLLLMVPFLAHSAALTFTATDAVDSIEAGGAVIAALGLAALLISIGVKMWKRFRSAA
jgi:hypothetical protein